VQLENENWDSWQDFPSLVHRIILGGSLGLKRKFSFSHFRKNFAKTYENLQKFSRKLLQKFSFSRNFLFSRKFSFLRKFSAKIFVFAKGFAKIFGFAKVFLVDVTKNFRENHSGNKILSRKRTFSQKRTFSRNEISRNSAKSE
jgi:hypothetical protein